MKWFIIFLTVAVILKGAFAEEEAKTSSRLPRSLPTKKNIYKLDHFIELVEKIERHPSITGKKPLKVIANYIRNFGYNNQKWEKLLGKSESLPDGILTAYETTVLRGMIDHGFSVQHEQGVVNTPYGDVAMGRVITGICAGINRNKDLLIPEIYGLSSKHIDNLYAATVAGDIGQTALINKIDPSKPLFGPGGTWLPNSECPEIFTSLTLKHSGATDAEILGGIDGFLMGLKLPEWWSVGKVRLGQLLRMYYHDGVAYDKNYAACRRFDKFHEMVAKTVLVDQATLSMYAVKTVWKEGMDFSGIQTSAIPKLAKAATQFFLTYLNRLNSRQMDCPKSNEDECNLPANLVFVMDESGSIKSQNYIVEKAFVKNITEAFDVSPYQTRVAVIEYATSFEVSINLNEYSSKSRLKCAVERLAYEGGSTYTSKAIQAAHDILKKFQSESGPSHVNDPQIIVLLTDGKSAGGEKVLKPLVESVKKNITGLTIVSVGIGNYLRSELELIATDPKKHVFTAMDFSKLVTLVKYIRSQTCKISTELKPVTVGARKYEGKPAEAKVSGYVSPGKARFFILTAETLFKTENISLQVKPTYGTVTLYVSRTNASPGPDNYDFKLEVGGTSISRNKRSTNSQPAGATKYLQLYNLCKGYNETSCPPLYVAVVGKNSSQSCSDRDCSVPTQIKFEIKTEQIVPKRENVCYFELQANDIYKAKDISVKVSAMKDTVSFYFSRVKENPDKMKHVESGQTRIITIPTPCAGKDKVSCPSVYLFFRGKYVKCVCTGHNCSLPSQVTIDVNVNVNVNVNVKVKSEPKVCFHQLSLEKNNGHKMIQIKVSPVNGTIAVYASRANMNPDESNHTQTIPPIAVGQTKYLNISRPCSGFHRSKCLPLYLTFIGSQLSCNCTGETGRQECTLPDQVSIIFTPGDVSSARPFQSTVWPLTTTLLLFVFL